jgi:hypothetical protein
MLRTFGKTVIIGAAALSGLASVAHAGFFDELSFEGGVGPAPCVNTNIKTVFGVLSNDGILKKASAQASIGGLYNYRTPYGMIDLGLSFVSMHNENLYNRGALEKVKAAKIAALQEKHTEDNDTSVEVQKVTDAPLLRKKDLTGVLLGPSVKFHPTLFGNKKVWVGGTVGAIAPFKKECYKASFGARVGGGLHFKNVIVGLDYTPSIHWNYAQAAGLNNSVSFHPLAFKYNF